MRHPRAELHEAFSNADKFCQWCKRANWYYMYDDNRKSFRKWNMIWSEVHEFIDQQPEDSGFKTIYNHFRAKKYGVDK